ncbi:unnamed protein product [Cylindrotheca closterium]|uniref:GPI ethanolamine phosphate transferase 1 n=1 Tax=Cylindrotheca closterium TaxID=2856 RepID=A0AAD2G1S2_9STRA|nr:unnamed protein product [Cylindrotheca closterium]
MMMVVSRQLILICLVLVVAEITNGFTLLCRNKRPRIVCSPHKQPQLQILPKSTQSLADCSSISIQVKAAHFNGDDEVSPPDGKAVAALGILSALTWIIISVTALSYHPDPKFANCTMRHNILTMSQAFAFPLPVGFASVSVSSSSEFSSLARPMRLAFAVASLWLAGASLLAPRFAFGFDLYSPRLKVAAGLVHLATAAASLKSWTRTATTQQQEQSLPPDYKPKASLASRLWGMSSLGLFWFTICPIFAPYPLATFPTILGKRLSRPASAFTLLGAALAFCLRQSELKGTNMSRQVSIARKCLLVGSSLHLLLIALKLIGVDGGGFLLAGNGLWEVYPAMLAVPFATASSLLIHVLVCIAATR